MPQEPGIRLAACVQAMTRDWGRLAAAESGIKCGRTVLNGGSDYVWSAVRDMDPGRC